MQTVNARFLKWPGYTIALLLILFPLLDTTLSVLPLRLGEVNWRFGAVGLYSRAFMTPALGLLIALAIALLSQHRGMLYTVALASALGCTLLICAAPLFAMDALQMRNQVAPEMKRAFDVATAVALAKVAIGCITTALLAFNAWKAARAGRHARSNEQVRVPIASVQLRSPVS